MWLIYNGLEGKYRHVEYEYINSLQDKILDIHNYPLKVNYRTRVIESIINNE